MDHSKERRSSGFALGACVGFVVALLFLLVLTMGNGSGDDSKVVAGDDSSLLSRFSVIRQIISREDSEESEIGKLELELSQVKQQLKEIAKSVAGGGAINVMDKSPPNLPALTDFSKEEKAKIEKARADGTYGGKGESLHLGGFTANDTMGQSPALWEWMLKVLTVKSFLDVGCGRGISTRFFLDHGADVLCVEGSHDALSQDRIVEHDYYRGPWWPDRTYDVVWSVEFLEHIGRQKAANYMATFKKGAIIFVTFSSWGGWHHVEVHPDGNYWLYKFAANGFIYMPELTQRFRSFSSKSQNDGFNAQHLWLHLLVFVNPSVASLPEHAHLFGGPGCYGNRQFQKCTGMDALPKNFLPVWSEKSKYDSMDPEMGGMPPDIDEEARAKSKEKGPAGTRLRRE